MLRTVIFSVFQRNSSHLARAPDRSLNTRLLTHRHNLVFFKLFSDAAPKCWNCGATKTVNGPLLCPHCNVLQKPPDTSNYFTVLNIDQTFDIDHKLLTNKYRRMQSVLHPDKYSNKSREEQEISSRYSSLVNNAYNTLRAPLKRAVHLLNLHGENVDEDQKIVDPEFLALIMELNEEIDAATTPKQLRDLDDKNRKELETIRATLSSHFKQLKVKEAKDEVMKMKYYNSIRMRINELLRNKGIVE
ncbi:hypothetical protein FQR65_LT13049 [Abscondita terminalis]|nr:hypothetical protein FQR65_LT13049 [Abscondita terminalis]